MPNRFGRLTPQQAAAMAKSFRETMPPHQAAEWTKALELLTDRPASPVRASATVDDGTGVADEFASLWPPRTKAEDEQRAEQRRLRVAASASVDDDDLYSAIFGESPR
jgi:hypothetical protein